MVIRTNLRRETSLRYVLIYLINETKGNYDPRNKFVQISLFDIIGKIDLKNYKAHFYVIRYNFGYN